MCVLYKYFESVTFIFVTNSLRVITNCQIIKTFAEKNSFCVYDLLITWTPCKMDVIDYEVEEISKIVERVICNSKIIVCMKSLVKYQIHNSK